MADSTTTPTTKGMGKEIGESGTIIVGGIVTGEEYNHKLTGMSAIKIYDEMRKSDATVRAALLACKLPILAAKRNVRPPQDKDGKTEDADEFNAKFLQRELFNRNINFDLFLKNSLSCFDFGYSVFEIVLGITNYEGKTMIGIEKLGFRKQTSVYKWETENQKPGITQYIPGKPNVSIPRAKLLVFTHDQEGESPEGSSLLRASYKDWVMKGSMVKFNAVALERLSLGIPVMNKPADADTKETEKAEQTLANIRNNEKSFISIPSGWTVEMLDMKASTTKDVLPSIHYHDRSVMKSVLAQFLELGASEGSGSRALSSDHSKLFMLAEEAQAKTIANAINEQLIKLLCDLNFAELKNGYPKFEFGKVTDEDMQVTAEAINKLMSVSAITPDEDVESHLREALHMPAMSEETRKTYEQKREAATKLLEAPATSDSNTNLDNKSKDKPSPDKNKADLKASALTLAQDARQRLINAVSGA